MNQSRKHDIFKNKEMLFFCFQTTISTFISTLLRILRNTSSIEILMTYDFIINYEMKKKQKKRNEKHMNAKLLKSIDECNNEETAKPKR
jgi:hypothetical protein